MCVCVYPVSKSVIPQSSLPWMERWCRGVCGHSVFSHSTGDSASCRGRRVCAVADHLHQRYLFPPSYLPLHHLGSCPGSHVAGPFCVGSVCTGSYRPHICCPARARRQAQ